MKKMWKCGSNYGGWFKELMFSLKLLMEETHSSFIAKTWLHMQNSLEKHGSYLSSTRVT